MDKGCSLVFPSILAAGISLCFLHPLKSSRPRKFKLFRGSFETIV